MVIRPCSAASARRRFCSIWSSAFRCLSSSERGPHGQMQPGHSARSFWSCRVVSVLARPTDQAKSGFAVLRLPTNTRGGVLVEVVFGVHLIVFLDCPLGHYWWNSVGVAPQEGRPLWLYSSGN